MKTHALRGRPRNFDRQVALEKAMNVFWLNGYEAASISDLTKAMSINPSSMYAAFGNKEQLFVEVLNYYLSHHGNYRLEVLQQAKTARQGIEALFTSTINQFYQRKNHPGCMVVSAALTGSFESQSIQTLLSQERRKTADLIRQRLQRGKDEGDIPFDVDIDTMTELFVTLFFGITVQAKDQVPIEYLHKTVGITLKLIPEVVSH